MRKPPDKGMKHNVWTKMQTKNEKVPGSGALERGHSRLWSTRAMSQLPEHLCYADTIGKQACKGGEPGRERAEGKGEGGGEIEFVYLRCHVGVGTGGGMWGMQSGT